MFFSYLFGFFGLKFWFVTQEEKESILEEY